MSIPISGVINTLNEEANIATALQSLMPWVDETIVVDMNSTDRTVEIAAAIGARVVVTDGPGFNMPPRAFALAQASHEWVFVLDADEMVPIKLARELRRLTDTDRWDAVCIPRRNYHFGAVLEYCKLGPEADRQLRMFRRPFVVASSIAHHDFSVLPTARLLMMPYDPACALVHFNYIDAVQYIEKLNRYTTVEAVQARARGERAAIGNLIYRPVREFVGRYIIRRGYRDGWRGLHVSLLMAIYRIVTNIKLRELERVGSRTNILSIYRQHAQQIIREYSGPDRS